LPALYACYQQGQGSGSWFIVDSSNTVIVLVMVEEKGKQTADKKEGRKPWTLREFGGQTLWDWLHLLSALAIPVVLAAAGLWFTAQQDQRQQRTETQRAEAERALAEQRAQDEALQAYLSQMSSLLLENDLRKSKEDSEVRTLARARTLTVLSRLDASRKKAVIQFLSEAQLIQSTKGRRSVIGLDDADLRDTDLSSTYLVDTDLSGADLSGARLTYLTGADLSNAKLHGADLSKAVLPEADLSGANLRNADLSRADLRKADLSSANLRNADLRYAALMWADLSYADLSDARVSVRGQLDLSNSLEGATMPDGQILKSDYLNTDGPTFEDWLKSKNRD
jgi:uncharacterized protein YjbI with pentapeptide repeats